MGTPREQLAQILRKARQEAGYESHIALARKMNVSRTVITKAENASQPIPSDAVLAAWSGLTGIGLDQIEELAKRCRSGTPQWFMPYLTAEQAATLLRCWGIPVIPGLAQTEAYMREILSVYPHTPERLTELVLSRLERQKVLDRTRAVMAIDVSVLSRCLGSPQVMADQMAHLVALAKRPNVSMHVVPEGANTGVWAPLEIASNGSDTTVCLTTGLDDVTSTAAAQIDNAVQAFERIIGDAMPLRESLDCLCGFEAKWKDQI